MSNKNEKYNYHIKSMYLYYKRYYPITYNELKLSSNLSKKEIIDIIKYNIFCHNDNLIIY